MARRKTKRGKVKRRAKSRRRVRKRVAKKRYKRKTYVQRQNAARRANAAYRQPYKPGKYLRGTYSTGPDLVVLRGDGGSGTNLLFDEAERRGEMMGMPISISETDTP